jgi:aminoglycoside phosphotransferase (APT) family kinase protein
MAACRAEELPLSADDVVIDVDLARRLLSQQFPDWAALPITEIASGWDNVTYRLGDDLSIRLPRYPRWVGQVEREHRWLPKLAPHLPLTVSSPVGQGVPGEGYPFPWSVYRWLDGENAELGKLTDPQQAARDLAGFITALQRIDATGGPGPEWSNGFRGVPMGDPRDSIAIEDRVRPKIAALVSGYDVGAVTAVWEASLKAPAWDRDPVWLHGDLAPGNLLMKDGRLSAIIDFGTLAVGDPACDLQVAWTFLTDATREAFREAVAVDEATWVRGRGWGLACCLPTPDDFGDESRLAERLARVDEIVADFRKSGS